MCISFKPETPAPMPEIIHGKIVLPGGIYYEGPLVKGRAHGQGKFVHPDQGCYEGGFVHGIPEGWGRYTYQSGEVCEGVFCQGKIQSDVRNLKDRLWLQLLAGKNGIAGLNEYALGIISSFLCRIGHVDLGSYLRSAHRNFCALGDESEFIHQKLEEREGSLLLLSCSDHAMGLNLVPDSRFLGSVLVEVFNSGEGLAKYHPLLRCYPNKIKFQTMWQARVPLTSITPEVIKQWTRGKPFKAATDVYTMILGLSGAKVVESDPSVAVYQSRQKGDNCTVEWIFAFLKNKMSDMEYQQMRKRLFSACFMIIKNDVQMDKGLRRELLREFLGKVVKRIFRVHRLCSPSSALFPKEGKDVF
jgi:hypothetical protein